MRLARRKFAWAVVAMSVASSPLARAADPKRPDTSVVAQARTHFERAVKLYAEDDYRAALIEFSRAYEIAPNWIVLYNVGQSYYQLRDYPNALGTLEKYVAQGGASIPAERRTQVDREVEELRGRVAHVTIESSKAGAELTIDDVAIGRTPLADAQLVGAGRHIFRATRAGLPAVTQVVDIAGGDTLTVRLTFAEPALPAPTPPAPPPPQREPTSHLPAYVAFAVGGAGVATGAVFGILAIGNKSTLTTECPSKTCPSSAQGDLNAYSRNGASSTVGFAIGGAGVAAGVVLYLLERGSDAQAPPASTTRTTRVEVTPWVGLGAGGLRGSF